jgi:hypothetical protein
MAQKLLKLADGRVKDAPEAETPASSKDCYDDKTNNLKNVIKGRQPHCADTKTCTPYM